MMGLVYPKLEKVNVSICAVAGLDVSVGIPAFSGLTGKMVKPEMNAANMMNNSFLFMSVPFQNNYHSKSSIFFSASCTNVSNSSGFVAVLEAEMGSKSLCSESCTP